MLEFLLPNNLKPGLVQSASNLAAVTIDPPTRRGTLASPASAVSRWIIGSSYTMEGLGLNPNGVTRVTKPGKAGMVFGRRKDFSVLT